MELQLDDAHQLFRIVHASIGVAGLGLFWIPLLAAKGSRLHIRAGRVFVWCAYFVGGTGVIASVWGLITPEHFFSSFERAGLTSAQMQLAVENVRFILSITGFLGFAVVSGVAMGVRIMHAPLRRGSSSQAFVLSLIIATLFWSTALVVYGLGTMLLAWMDLHFLAPAGASRYLLCVAFGAFGVYGAIGDWQIMNQTDSTASERQSTHIQCMLGAGAAFYAAFFLFGASRLFDLTSAWQLLLPIVPLIVVHMFASKMLVQRYATPLHRETREH